jgi:hypothetical protein
LLQPLLQRLRHCELCGVQEARVAPRLVIAAAAWRDAQDAAAACPALPRPRLASLRYLCAQARDEDPLGIGTSHD